MDGSGGGTGEVREQPPHHVHEVSALELVGVEGKLAPALLVEEFPVDGLVEPEQVQGHHDCAALKQEEFELGLVPAPDLDLLHVDHLHQTVEVALQGQQPVVVTAQAGQNVVSVASAQRLLHVVFDQPSPGFHIEQPLSGFDVQHEVVLHAYLGVAHVPMPPQLAEYVPVEGEPALELLHRTAYLEVVDPNVVLQLEHLQRPHRLLILLERQLLHFLYDRALLLRHQGGVSEPVQPGHFLLHRRLLLPQHSDALVQLPNHPSPCLLVHSFLQSFEEVSLFRRFGRALRHPFDEAVAAATARLPLLALGVGLVVLEVVVDEGGQGVDVDRLPRLEGRWFVLVARLMSLRLQFPHPVVKSHCHSTVMRLGWLANRGDMGLVRSYFLGIDVTIVILHLFPLASQLSLSLDPLLYELTLPLPSLPFSLSFFLSPPLLHLPSLLGRPGFILLLLQGSLQHLQLLIEFGHLGVFLQQLLQVEIQLLVRAGRRIGAVVASRRDRTLRLPGGNWR